MAGRFDELDGRIGQGWGGPAGRHGCHVNVVLARRGSPTAAALMTAFTSPRAGHTPILVCVGERKTEYEPVWPPTVMVAKSPTQPGLHETITFGAAQLGLGQGVLDAVADGSVEPVGDTIVFVAVWIHDEAHDETKVRHAARAATHKGVTVAARGRDPEAARSLVERRESLRNPYCSGS